MKINHLNIKDIFEGIKMALPIMAGYVPLGFACGIVCAQAGMNVFQIFLMSALVYAGAGQYIAGAMLSAGATPLSIIITTLIVNSRHILYTSVLYPYVAGWSFLKQSLFAFQITDEAFAVHSTSMAKNQSNTVISFSVNIFSHFSWITSNVLGGISASLIPDATKFGLDFTLCALFIALILPKLINIPQVLAFITGGVTALCFLLIDMKYEGIIIGALIGAFAGYFMNMRLHHGK